MKSNMSNRFPGRRAVSARLVERFIFNFRVAPEALEKRLPVSWLKPQVIRGFGVVSFCILKIERLMLWPLPSVFGLETVSCAYRCGVIDISGAENEPSVYIIGRNTDRWIIARLAPAILSDPMARIRASITRKKDHVGIQARFLQGTQLFSAKVKPAKSSSILKSEVFDSLDGFVDFIKGGVSSYTPSVRDNYYARVDLYKEDARYEAVDATIDFNSLDLCWPEAGLIFDSAVRAGGGGLYRWTYRGELPREVRTESYPLLNSDTTSGIPSL